MAVDMFLKFEGVDGESVDAMHKGWVDILSFSFGVSQPSSAVSSAAAGTAERASFSNFTIVKTLDKASPVLMQACASGQHLPSITIQAHRTEGGRQELLRYTLQDCIISSVRPGGNAKGADVRPMEEVSFSFGKITLTYIPQKADGTADAPAQAGWDLAKNTKV